MKPVRSRTPGTPGLEGDAGRPSNHPPAGSRNTPRGMQTEGSPVGWDCRLDLGWQLGLGTPLDPLAALDSQKHPQKIHGESRLEPSLEDGSVPSLCGDNHCPLLPKSLF